MKEESIPSLFEFIVGIWMLIAGIVWVHNEVAPTLISLFSG